MKKLLFSFAFASFLATMNAQQFNVDFESLTLVQADTFNNGSDDAGGFTLSNGGSNSATFSNVYTDFGGGFYGWNGFSYSNVTDVTTAGFGNQYASYAGSGANSSAKYAVFYPTGIITFQNAAQVDSVKLTNTTYTALSMLNGDAYAKQFGSTMDANGVVDGTNGEDFLRVWIIGMNDQMLATDSVEFYLADYRFSNNTEDYILNTWENVDLSSLGFVKHLAFKFESSDEGQWGINTPTYFAMDDLHFTNVLATGEISADQVQVYPNPVKNTLNVKGLNGQLTVRNVEGKVLSSQTHDFNTTLDFSTYESGIYFISIENESGKATQKVIK